MSTFVQAEVDAPSGRTAKLLLLRSLQRQLQVGPQILDVLDPDREAQQAVGKTNLQPLLSRYRRVGHGGGMAHQALHSPQALGAGEQPEAVEHPPPGFERAIPRNERDHASETGGLTSGEPM